MQKISEPPVEKVGVKQIIYLGGLSDLKDASPLEKFSIMITPRWVNTPTYPITFKEMMLLTLLTAEVLGLRRIIIGVLVLSQKLSSYWLTLFIPVNFELARELVLGLKSKTLKGNDNAEKYFYQKKITPFKEAKKLM